MANMRKINDNKNNIIRNIQKQYKKLFSKPDEPPTSMSLSEEQALKARITELETRLAEQPTASEHGISNQPGTTPEFLPSGDLDTQDQAKETEKTRWRFLSAPVFEDDEEKTRTAKLLHQIIIASCGLPPLAIIVGLLSPAAAGFVLPVGLILAITLATLIMLNYAGKVKLASNIIIATLFIAFTYLNYVSAGEPRPLLLLTVVVIMMSGLLLGGRGTIITAILLIAQQVVIVYLGAKGIIAPQAALPSPLQNILVSSVGYLLITAMLRMATSMTRTALDKVRKDEKELKLRNRELLEFSASLEQRVADRTHDLELAFEVGHDITQQVGNLSALLSQATESIRSRFDLYYTQAYLTDPSGHNLVLRAGTGDAGQQLLRRGHRLAIASTSLNGRAAVDRKAVLVGDTQKSGNFLPNPLLPQTRSELAIPLIVNNKVMGVLDMQSARPDTFSEANLPAYQVLAGQLAIAIQNAALFDEATQARAEIEERAGRLASSGWQNYLNAVERSEKIGFVFSQNEVLPLVETETTPFENAFSVPIQIAGADIGEIQLADLVDRKWTLADAEIVQATVKQIAQHIENLRLLAQAESYRAQAEQASQRLTREGWMEYLKARQELASGYIYSENQVQPLNGNRPQLSKQALSYPIIVRAETIGELVVNPNDDTDADPNEFITAITSQLSDHIENLRLLEQAEQQRLEAEGLTHELETVATVSSTTSTELDPQKLLNSVVDLTKESFDLYHAHIYLVDKDTDSLVLTAGAGEVGRSMVAEGRSIPREHEHSLVARTARERRAVISNDVRKEPDFLPNPLLPETRAEMAVPMIVGDELLGVFDVQANVVDRFDEGDVRIKTTLAAQVAIALQNARLYVEQENTVRQLRELDRLKSSFLANMSHELRTPLNSILGFADVMLEGLDGPLTENMDNDLGLIYKNGQHLLHLINDVLDMAKIEAGRLNLNPETFRLQELIDEVTSLTSTFASERSLSLFIEEGSDETVEIFADRTRIRQVLINLINNAIKFTDKGKIAINSIQKDDRVLISVRDTGIGISPEKLEAVFQEFTQVDTTSTRKVGGTGLGLPISRKLVEMHGGRVWAESSGVNGEGSIFYVDLPLEAVILDAEQQEK